MAHVSFMFRFAVGACGAVIVGTSALAQTSPPASGSGLPPTATITTPGYPAAGPADPKLRVVGLPNGKKVHVLPATLETTQWGWFDNSQPPVLRVHSGDTVVLETMMHSHNQVVPGATIEQIKKLRTDFPGRGPHTLTGPIYIEEAQPGDVLSASLRHELQRAGHVRPIPHRVSGRPGQVYVSRPRKHDDRVSARHRPAGAALPGHARRRAQGTGPLLERSARGIRRQHGYPRLRRRDNPLCTRACAGRAALEWRLSRRPG